MVELVGQEFGKEQMIYLLDIFGTFVFAVTGAMMSATKKMDLAGALFLAFVTATGGGTFRDMILGNTPVFWVTDINYILAVFAGVATAFFFSEAITKMTRPVLLFDAVGLGVFTIIGADKASAYGIPLFSIIILSVVTAVLGGIIRDVLGGEVPLIFKKEIYATACFLGAVIYTLLLKIGISVSMAGMVSVITVITVRIVSIKYSISLPGVGSIIRKRYMLKKGARTGNSDI